MSDKAGFTGFNNDRLEYLIEVMKDDISRGKYHGGVLCIGRNGVVALHEAVGHAYRDQRQALTKDNVFSLFSLTKAFTNVLIYRAIERGELALTTTVSSVIPGFSGGLRENITIYHLMTHQTGIPPIFMLKPGMYIDRLDEIIEAICEVAQVTDLPGNKVDYSPMVAHALLGEMASRVDPRKRRYRQLVLDEIFTPLKMKDSAIGVRKDLKARKVVPDFLSEIPMTHPGHSNLGPHGAFEEEEAEMPWVGGISTAGDIYRFAEMLRRGGELEGARVLGPAIIDKATRLQTGDKPNELYKAMALGRGWEPYPAYIGIGFSLRGYKVCHHQFGTLTSPRTFGNHGAGSTIFWVDPELDMTFVCLTAGVMDEGDNTERFQRLSDIAVSAAI